MKRPTDWRTYSGSPGWLYASLEFEGGGSIKVFAPETVARAAMRVVDRGIEEVERAEEELYAAHE